MFAFLGVVFSWLWGGISAALEATVVALQWAVGALWAFATSVYNGLLALGRNVLHGFQRAWDFLKATYDDVLKPAWSKFWTLFDRVRRWLDATFAPVFRFLKAVRDAVLCFYAKWIRPILDIVDATRGILRVLARLHVPFAAALERQVGKAEDWINRKFELVLATINEIVNVVNRVVTADGLFNRVAFLRTYVRDIDLAFRALHFSRLAELTDDERAALDAKEKQPSPRQTLDAFIEYCQTGGGPMAPYVRRALAGTEDIAGSLDERDTLGG